MSAAAKSVRSKIRPRKSAVVVLALATAIGAAGCSSSGGSSNKSVAKDCKPAHKFTTLKKATLAVATEDAPPYGGVKASKLTGVDGGIVHAIAKMECLAVDAKLVDGSAVIPSVQAGKVDLGMGDWYRTAERLKTVQMSNGMYLDQNAFVSKKGVGSFSDLKKLRVGSRSGVNFDNGLQKYLGGKLVLYATGNNLYQDLKVGRLDVVVDSAGAAAVAAGKQYKVVVPDSIPPVLGTTFDPTAAGLVTNRDDGGLLAAMNADLGTLRKNGMLLKIATQNGLPGSAIKVGGS